MPETFDPYRKWLGIPPHEQPPNHYRLLGIGLFERDPDVIQEAADRQMSHVQTHKIGKNADLSQKLLNELTAAKLCLLNAERQAAYDEALRRQMAEAAPKPAVVPTIQTATPVPTIAAPVTVTPDFTTDDTARKRSSRPRSTAKKRINPIYVLVPATIVAIVLLMAIISKLRSNDEADAAREQALVNAKQQEKKKLDELAAASAARKAKAAKARTEFSRPETARSDDLENPLTPADDGIPTEPDEPEPELPPVTISPEEVAEMQPGGAVQAVALSPNGARAVTGGRDGSVRVWDMSNYQELRRLEGHEGFINAVAFFPDSRRAVTAGHDGSVRLYDTETGKQLWSHVDLRLPMTSVAVSADSKFIVAGGHQKIVRVWDFAKNTQLPEWSGLPEHIYGVGISPDGRRVFAGCGGYWKRGKPDSGDDFKLHMRDLTTSKETEFKGHEACIWSVAVSNDGRRAATGCFDGSIRIWSVMGGSTLHVLQGHKGSVWSVAFSKDGRRLVSGGDDRTVRLWDVDNGKQLKQLDGHVKAVNTVSISGDGRTILSGGNDLMARVWKLTPPTTADPAEAPANATANAKEKDPPAAVAAELPDYFAPAKLQGQPMPAEAEQQEKLKLVRQVFADDYKAAHKPQEKIALAEKLLEQADQSADSAERYVLYSEARSKARESGNSELIIQVVEKMGGYFAIDAYDELADVLGQLGRELQPPLANKELAEKMLPLAERAIASERYDVARRLLATAYAAAGKTNDKQLAKEIKTRGSEIVEIKKHYDAAKAALARLKQEPLDPAANLALGRYLCFDKNDWQAGLPLLARGDNQELKKLAEQELVAPATAEDQVKLADAWWAYAESSDSKEKSDLQGRAERWYRDAVPGLKGLTQTRVQKRLQELDELRPKVAVKAPDRPAPLVNVGPTKNPGKSPATSTTVKGDKEKPATAVNMAATARALTGRMKAATRKKINLARTQIVGGTYGNVYEEVPGMLLVGFNYTLNNNNYVSSIQPIYQSGKGTTTGTAYGFVNGAPQQMMAKPGYAIGGLRAQGTYYIFGFQAQFMKVDSKGNLDPADAYMADWVGRNYSGDNTLTMGGDGQPIVGVFGKASNQQIQSMGLVQLPSDAK